MLSLFSYGFVFIWLAYGASCRLLLLSFFFDSICAQDFSSCFSWFLYGEADCHVSSFPRQLIESLHNVLGEFSFCMLSVWVLTEFEPVTWMPAVWRLPCLIIYLCYFWFFSWLFTLSLFCCYPPVRLASGK